MRKILIIFLICNIFLFYMISNVKASEQTNECISGSVIDMSKELLSFDSILIEKYETDTYTETDDYFLTKKKIKILFL